MPAQAKYGLIADHLAREIRDGQYAVGSLLPTESALMRAYGVSRHTVRNAIRELRERNLVASRQGQGSTVVARGTEPVFVEHIQSIDELVTLGQETRRELVGSRVIEADDDLARAFGCAPGRRLCEVAAVRRESGPRGRPLAVMTLWLDLILEPVVASLEDARTSVAEIIGERFGYTTRSVVQTIVAAPLSPDDAHVLGAEAGAPALVLERAYATAPDATPFLIARSVCRADATKVVSRFASTGERADGAPSARPDGDDDRRRIGRRGAGRKAQT